MRINQSGLLIGLLTLGVGLILFEIIVLIAPTLPLWDNIYLFIIFLILDNCLFHQCINIKDDVELQIIMIIIHIIFFLGGGIVFFVLFFNDLYPLQTIQFQSSSSCRVEGQMTINLQGSESYSILYTKFIVNGEELLGYACRSNNSQAPYHMNPHPYEFIREKQYYLCERPVHKNQYSYDVTPQSIKRRRSQEQDVFFSSKVSGLGKQKGCKPYSFSKIKLPSWLCINSAVKFEEMVKLQPCYFSFYKNLNKGYENAIFKRDLRKIINFAFVTFKYPVYFDEVVEKNIIRFGLIPFLISFESIIYLLVEFKSNH